MADPIPAVADKPRQDLSEVVQLLNRVQKRLRKDSGERREIEEKLASAVADISEKMNGSFPVPQRRGEFAIDDRDPDLEGSGAKVLDSLIRRPALNDESRALHKVNDDMYLLQTILREPNPLALRYFKEAMREIPILRKSLDTTANGFANWVPTAFSDSLHEQVRLAFLVAALHERINMPQDPYRLPVEGADATAYLVPEQGDSDANLDATKMVCPSFSGATNTPAVTAPTLTSKKIGARMTFSEEASEDAIIPVLPYLRRKAALAMANAQENTTQNGDTAGTHMDADVTATIDARKAWDGYRKSAITANAAVTVTNTASTVKSVSLTDIRSVRQKMGKYGTDPSQLAIIVSPQVYIKCLSMEGLTPSATNVSPVTTVDKYGPNATVITGELAKVDGIPILVSAFARENLGTGGVQTGGTVDRSVLTIVNRNGFLYGDRRAATLKARDIIETDQTVLVILQRLTLAKWFGADPVAGFVFNIQM